jgi:DNA-binding transcriptional ArsR family regulator
VPRLIEPPGQSQEVIAVMEIMGSRAASAILNMLSTEGPLITAEIARRLRIDYNRGAHRLLVDLRKAGLVKSESVDGRGTMRWSVVPEELPRAAKKWLDYVSGTSD